MFASDALRDGMIGKFRRSAVEEGESGVVMAISLWLVLVLAFDLSCWSVNLVRLFSD